MFVLANQPQVLSEVIKDTFRLFKYTFRSCIFFALIGPIIGKLLDFLGRDFMLSEKTHFMMSIVFFLLLMAIMVFFSGTLLHWIRALILDKQASLAQSISVVRSKFLSLYIACFCFYVLVFLGMLAFVIPGFIAVVFFIFYMPSILFDELGPLSALANSCKLVYGSWWQTLFLCFFVTIFVSITIFFVSFLLALSKEGFFLASLFFMAIFNLFMTALILVQFNNLKLKALIKESSKA